MGMLFEAVKWNVSPTLFSKEQTKRLQFHDRNQYKEFAVSFKLTETIETFTIPVTGNYRITACGAKAADGTFKRGIIPSYDYDYYDYYYYHYYYYHYDYYYYYYDFYD